MSRWPPRTMAKLSAWWKNEAPGFSVTAFLPALIRSQSSAPFARRLAEIQDAVLGVEDRLAAGRLVLRHHSRGSPMPRLT